MIGGFTPFRSPDPNTLYDNIVRLKISWPKNADKIAKDLISKMLVVEPEMRISLSDAKEHQFFKDIDWDLITKKKEDPPFVPQLDDDFSLEYFKNDDKMEMYHNPLYKFDKHAGISTKLTHNSSVERKFNALGNYQVQKVNQMLEDF